MGWGALKQRRSSRVCSSSLDEPGANKPCLSWLAANQLALAQDGESEVTTGRTAPMTPEGIQLPVVFRAPLLHHAPPLEFGCAVPGQRSLATLIRTSITRLRFMASAGLNTELLQAVGWSPVLRGSGDFSFSVEDERAEGSPLHAFPSPMTWQWCSRHLNHQTSGNDSH